MLTPAAIAQDPTWLIIDIRPLSERLDPDLGFIPGSLHLPLTLDDLRTSPIPFALRNPKAALTCTSGRRSAALLSALHDVDPSLSLYHLPAGVLGWRADGLPVAGTPDIPPSSHPIPPDLSLSTFPRLLASCFVSELVESALNASDDDLDDLDPLLTLRQCFHAEAVSWDAPDLLGLYRVLDRAAMSARLMSSPLHRICANLNWALRCLHALSVHTPLPHPLAAKVA
jgi:rhodanese-related sulfurtransferase